MSVPDQVRNEVKLQLWKKADELGWLNLGPNSKSRWYENWVKDPQIGGRLSRFLDARRIRVYIKDTLLKDYPRARRADSRLPLRALGLREDVLVSESFIKPHGLQLEDGRVICWGRADDWKGILMAVYERSFGDNALKPFGAVLLSVVPRFISLDSRRVVENAAESLGITKLVWIE